MKKIFIILAIFNTILMIFMIFEFMALNDIFNDYLSKKNFASKNFSMKASDEIPEWTDCKSEWNFIRINFIIKIIFVVFVTVIIIKHFTSTKNNT